MWASVILALPPLNSENSSQSDGLGCHYLRILTILMGKCVLIIKTLTFLMFLHSYTIIHSMGTIPIVMLRSVNLPHPRFYPSMFPCPWYWLRIPHPCQMLVGAWVTPDIFLINVDLNIFEEDSLKF